MEQTKLKPMKLLILEDSEYDCNRFKNSARNRTDIEFIAITNSCDEALKYVKFNHIEGIILDLELHKGHGGSGLSFLEKLNSFELDTRPIIIVTTNILSERVHRTVRNLGIDMLFCKNQSDYSPELILDSFIMLRNSISHDIPTSIINDVNSQTKKNQKDWISDKIYAELDKIGIINKLKGREYIFEAIYYVLENDEKDKYFLPYLMKKYTTGNTNILNGMQTAINYAWKNTPPDELVKFYTAKVSVSRGVPTPTELVHYYVDKIKKVIN